MQTNEISDGAVTEPKLATGAITNGKIADAAVTNAKIVDGAVTTNKVAESSITSPKLANGAVTNVKLADGAVTDAKILGVISGAKLGSHEHYGSDIVDGTISSTKIADGAINDAKITGPISASKIEQGTGSGLNADLLEGMHANDFSKKPANVIVVAKSGGDFSSIADALASINPTAETPYLIKVMPGTYTENITMKSYTYLQGTGRDVTTIQSPIDQAHVITIPNLSNVTISDIAITKSGNYGSFYGVYIESSSSVAIMSNIVNGGLYIWSSLSVSIMENIIPSSNYAGIQFVNSSPLIVGNTISGNGYGIQGIATSGHYVPIISRNIIIQNGNGILISGASWGGLNHCAPEITENIIEGNNSGISLFGSSPKIVRNIITGNQGGDLYLEPSSEYPSLPNISFNMYDTMTGTGVGAFNVKSNGTAW